MNPIISQALAEAHLADLRRAAARRPERARVRPHTGGHRLRALLVRLPGRRPQPMPTPACGLGR